VMAELDVKVEDFRVTERGFDFGMAQELLHLVDRHPALQGQGRGGVSEDVRRDMHRQIATGYNLLHFILYGL